MKVSKNMVLYSIKQDLPILKLSNNVYNRCSKILESLEKDNEINLPFTIATISAGLIFISSIIEKEKRTQREISTNMNVSEMSICKFKKYLEAIAK